MILIFIFQPTAFWDDLGCFGVPFSVFVVDPDWNSVVDPDRDSIGSPDPDPERQK
jgi:hypothetical protein